MRFRIHRGPYGSRELKLVIRETGYARDDRGPYGSRELK